MCIYIHLRNFILFGYHNVYTPEELSKLIIKHFCVSGKVMDPCKGYGSFYNNFPKNEDNDWCEISDGRNFLDYKLKDENSKFDFVCTNPPWSLLRPFLNKSMEISDNVIFLCLINAFFMKARLRDMNNNNFGIKEILPLKTPQKPWPQTGFQLGAVHIQKNYNGPIIFNKELIG